MADREKVIKGLECCKWSRQNVKPEKNKCDECPYKDQNIMNAFSVWRSCTNVLAGDALALLKEQEEQKWKWLQNIADNQLANAPMDGCCLEQWNYQKGVYDGLQMAYDILTEGR